MVLEELKNIYHIISNQIVFIESKNGALIVFNVTILATLLDEISLDGLIIKISIIGLVISCIIGLISFSPFSYKCDNVKAIDFWNNSLIYFRNIAKYDSHRPDLYINDICKSLKIDNIFHENDFVYSYAYEVIILSKIIAIKDTAFRRAGIITICSLLLMILARLVK